jgi:hypothetical protein
VDEAEIRDLKWWSNYHKESAKWLAIRIHQVLVEGKEDIVPILLASLPAFLEEYAHPAPYHFPNPEVKTDETNTKATE